MEPLYKVGDRVKVIARVTDLDPKDYRFGFVDNMTLYTGKIVTIASIRKPPIVPVGLGLAQLIQDDGYLYSIVEDRGFYNWASSMFQPLQANIMSQSSDTPTTIKIKVKTNQLKFNFKN